MELASKVTAARDLLYRDFAAVAHAVVPDPAVRTNGLLRTDRKHSVGADGPSPIHPHPPARLSPRAIYEFPSSLTEGFTPKLRLHI